MISNNFDRFSARTDRSEAVFASNGVRVNDKDAFIAHRR
jgi:hypothetical protein